MSTPALDTIYNTFIDESACVEEHVTIPGAPEATWQTTIEAYLALEKQELEYAAAVSPRKMPGLAQESPSSSTIWDGDSYLTNFRSSRVLTPGPIRPTKTPDTSRYHPYSPSRWETPAVTSPSVRQVGGMWLLSVGYEFLSGLRCPRPRSGSTRSPARAIFPSFIPRPHARNDDDDIFVELAASVSSPATTSRSPKFSSSETKEDGEEEGLQLDTAAATNPANKSTNNVHSQLAAMGGGVATVGQGLIPLPADRDALLDRLQQGLHIQCILPSTRNSAANIVCMGQHFLQPDGTFTQGEVCRVPFGSEDSYGWHIKVRHIGMDPKRTLGALHVKKWIHLHRPGVYIQEENPGLVVQGARARGKDPPRRRRA